MEQARKLHFTTFRRKLSVKIVQTGQVEIAAGVTLRLSGVILHLRRVLLRRYEVVKAMIAGARMLDCDSRRQAINAERDGA